MIIKSKNNETIKELQDGEFYAIPLGFLHILRIVTNQFGQSNKPSTIVNKKYEKEIAKIVFENNGYIDEDERSIFEPDFSFGLMPAIMDPIAKLFVGSDPCDLCIFQYNKANNSFVLYFNGKKMERIEIPLMDMLSDKFLAFCGTDSCETFERQCDDARKNPLVFSDYIYDGDFKELTIYEVTKELLDTCKFEKTTALAILAFFDCSQIRFDEQRQTTINVAYDLASYENLIRSSF